MPDSADDLVETVKGGVRTAADWMSGGPISRLLTPTPKPQGEPFKFDGPKEKEEQAKANSKPQNPTPTTAGQRMFGKKAGK